MLFQKRVIHTKLDVNCSRLISSNLYSIFTKLAKYEFHRKPIDIVYNTNLRPLLTHSAYRPGPSLIVSDESNTSSQIFSRLKCTLA